MNRNRYFVLTLIAMSLVLLMGCSDGSSNPPSSSFVDRSMVDYDFADITSNCQTYNNINMTEYNNNDSYTQCVAPKEETFIFYTEANNWTLMCCEFNDECVSVTKNYSEGRNLCENMYEDKYTGYAYNDDGFWMAQCCNANGSLCYVDLTINVTDDSTVCDEDYHMNSYNVDFNGTHWSGKCCLGGIEE